MDELEAIVGQLEDENNRRAATDPLVKTALGVVEELLKQHKVICYGGTAINNLLPKEDQFYNPETDIPDYDFFSQTPQEHAMILANKLNAAGIKDVEVKPGMHLGTFKVFADYEGVADITQLDEDIFGKLWDANIVKNGIHYATPDFLRMSMYLELSRPRGDVSRWKKVYSRLKLLNKHYPIVCKKEESEPHPSVPMDLKRQVKEMLKHEDVVLLGVNAAETHLRETWTLPVTLLATKETIERLTKGLDVHRHEGSEILPPLYFVHFPGEPEGSTAMLRFYETTACHSYHQVGGIRVASIPTILQFFFAYMYSTAKQSNIESILCIAQRLMDLADNKPKRRFALLTPIDCIGTQKTLIDMRREKAELYTQTSKNKLSAEFLQYFFTYNPSVGVTQRKKAREALRKTRKVRTETV
jgi:hypothetical protein